MPTTTPLDEFRAKVADIRSFAERQDDVYFIACATTLNDLGDLLALFVDIHDGDYADSPILRAIRPLIEDAKSLYTEKGYDDGGNRDDLIDHLVTAAAYILLDYTAGEHLWTI